MSLLGSTFASVGVLWATAVSTSGSFEPGTALSLLRQYLPHAIDMTSYSQAQLDAIARRLNTRPRMTLGYRTPAVRLAEIVASTD